MPETIEKATEARFKSGDLVIEDKDPSLEGSPDLPARVGRVIAYKAVPDSADIVQPVILWADGSQGFTKAAYISPYSGDIAIPEISDEALTESRPLELAERLEAEERVITANKNKIMLSFQIIFEDELWRAGDFASFEEYCDQVWGIKKSQAYALKTGGQVVSGLLDSGVPESELPTSISAAEAISAAPVDDRPNVLKETQERDGRVTAKGIKKTLKGKPSRGLLLALWAQVGKVTRMLGNAESDEFKVSPHSESDPAVVFATVAEAQAAWELNGQRLSAIALNSYRPNEHDRMSLSMVPVKVVGGPMEDVGKTGYIMGGFPPEVVGSEQGKAAYGLRISYWHYAVLLDSDAELHPLCLHEVKVRWEETQDWQPQKYDIEPVTPANERAEVISPEQPSANVRDASTDAAAITQPAQPVEYAALWVDAAQTQAACSLLAGAGIGFKPLKGFAE